MPTNQWWSSVLWMPLSEAQYPHPLAVRAEKSGLRVFYPGAHISASAKSIMASMGGGRDDLTLTHSAEEAFAEARVHGFSDWFVTVRFGSQERGMDVSYGHGSPLVYALYRGGTAKIVFGRPPEIWAGKLDGPALAVTVGNKHYGLFGPRGSAWSTDDGRTFLNSGGGKAYLSVALLPERSPAVFELFARYAHSHVTGTQVQWRYNPSEGTVTTEFLYATLPHEGQQTGTLFALYPHQWRYSDVKLLPYQYTSVRGAMKLAAGTSFATRMTFPGVLPALPATANWQGATVDRYLEEDSAEQPGAPRDTYWEGKWLGKQATLAALAQQNGNRAMHEKLLRRIRQRLEQWFTATDAQGALKSAGLFYYNNRWGALIGYPAAYGSDVELNDHHFHYGYFLRAAAEVVREDPTWAQPQRWGGMLRTVIADVACPERDNKQFPFLRTFDVYAGHSWASGHARFADGNNQESSSEAMNAWCALILVGEALGDVQLRDLGIYLFTTELAAINEYWFDVSGQNRPKAFTEPAVGIIWGGKADYATWFSSRPEAIHGINWLPFHSGSLYLGLYPEYVRRNYAALLAKKGGPKWEQWADLIWMYRALDDPQDALSQFNAQKDSFRPEAGNSKTNTYCWLHTLAALGQVDRSVWADHPLYAVFRKGNTRTYVAFNMRATPLTVRFSDGVAVTVQPRSLAITSKNGGSD